MKNAKETAQQPYCIKLLIIWYDLEVSKMVTGLLHGDLHIEKKHNSNRQWMLLISSLKRVPWTRYFFGISYFICIQEISKYQGVNKIKS